MLNHLEKARLLKASDKVLPNGFTKDFYDFLGLGKKAQNYKHSLPAPYLDKLTGDSQNYFTPIDDLWGSPEGADTVYDYGRVPLSHLMTLASQRLGIVFRACNGTAGDVFRNKFEFVDIDNEDKVYPLSKEKLKYLNDSKFWDKCVDMLDFEHRSGLGHLVARYKKDTDQNLKEKAPNERPESFESFSAYHMTPINIYDQSTLLDYDKSKWTYIGGIVKPAQIHFSRVYTLETRRVEGGFRGLALAELCWIPLMCYLNTMYYVLKALSRLGVVMGQFNVDKEYPTPTETAAYISLWDAMEESNCVVMGKNATFNLENTAGKIGSGLDSYLEFLREDISAAWIYPKNQLFGRAEGGGLEGAGALVSKEDYLGSNISVKQLQITNDVMYILTNICKFSELENKTLRWNIDLHKTEKTRIEEQLMHEQLEVAKINTKQVKKYDKLYSRQIELQKEMADTQLKMIKRNPEAFMETSDKDEENLAAGEAKPKKGQTDFTEDMKFLKLKLTYDTLFQEYQQNKYLIENIKPINIQYIKR